MTMYCDFNTVREMRASTVNQKNQRLKPCRREIEVLCHSNTGENFHQATSQGRTSLLLLPVLTFKLMAKHQRDHNLSIFCHSHLRIVVFLTFQCKRELLFSAQGRGLISRAIGYQGNQYHSNLNHYPIAHQFPWSNDLSILGQAVMSKHFVSVI